MNSTLTTEITGFLWEALTKGGILLVFAGLTSFILQRRSAATRHFIWFASLIAVMALPLFSRLVVWPAPDWPAWEYSESLLNKITLTINQPISPIASVKAEKSDVSKIVQGLLAPQQGVKSHNLSWAQFIVGVWGLGVLVLGARLLFGYSILGKLGRTAKAATGTTWQDLQKSVQLELNEQRKVRILLSNKSVMPMTWGWRRPTVLLPAEAENWTDLRRQLVLQHELAHVKRNDWAIHFIVNLVCLIYWFHPLVWLGAHRMRIEREQACDDLVIKAGAPAVDYASHLLEIALEFSTVGGPALRMARAGGLEQRLRAIVATERVREQLRPLIVIVTLLVVMGASLVISGCRKKETTISAQKIPAQILQFCSDKEKQTRALVGDKKVPTELWAFFAACNRGDWQAVTNYYSSICAQKSQYGETMVEARDTGFWSTVHETYAALEQLETVERKYAESFAHEVIDSIPAGSVYFGGTDAGRFLITAFSKSHREGDPFFTLTQNALADRSYLIYLRSMYGEKLAIPNDEDADKCFMDYIAEAQQRLHDNKLKPDEHVVVTDGRVQVSGIDAVMEINAGLTKLIFDKTPDRQFYIEESWPLEWMYPHLTPHGLILKVNREPVTELSEQIVQQDQDYWDTHVGKMIGNWLQAETPVSEVTEFARRVFARHDERGFNGDLTYVRSAPTCRMFSKERCSIAGVYQWRMEHATSPSEKTRMTAAADLAYRQAFALCPSSPDTVSRYVHFLLGQQRIEDAQKVAEAAVAIAPMERKLADALKEAKSR